MIRLLLTYFFVSILFSLYASEDVPVFFYKNQQLHTADGEKVVRGIEHIFVEGDINELENWLGSNDGFIKYHYNGIAAVQIKAENIESLRQEAFIKQIDKGNKPLVQLMDTSLIIHNVNQVHDGVSPLDMAYKGEGVVVGIIDAGIFYNHEDFKDENGSRIKYMWDQNASNLNPPMPYIYGTEWTFQDFENGNVNHSEPANRFGHGTHVTGAAASSGREVENYKGVAPKSDLIIVAYDYQDPTLSKFVDAVEYIFRKADAMGKPVVINASLGTYYGSRDARDLPARLIENMLEERAGRVLVAAAGNRGNVNYHLGYDVTADTTFTWFRYTSTFNVVYYELFADTADLNDVWFSIGADDTSFQFLGQTEFFNVKNQFVNLNPGDQQTISRAIYHQGAFVGAVILTVRHQGHMYKVEIEVNPANTTDLWRFIATGDGRIDIWSSQSIMGHSNMVEFGLPPASIVPEIVNYKLPDNAKTLVSSFTCSDKVITVGNAEARYAHENFNGTTTVVAENPVGIIHPTSSRGPTRDERVKPDITASGTRTMATGNLTNVNALISSGQANRVAPEGMHSTNGGTSLAAPKVAGAAALYLQKNPDAWYFEVKDAITLSALEDDFTPPLLPDETYGWGKLNVFGAIQMDLNYGCTDPDALNFDADANMDDGSCVEAVHGCTDELATNFNPEANVDDGSCFYDTTSVHEILVDGQILNLNVYPNPAEEYFYIEFDKVPENRITYELSDLTGRIVLDGAVPAGETFHKINVVNLPKGLFLLNFQSAKSQLLQKKILLQ
ncbi:MAG: T9SS C-terminal target domain-containing protein [Chitinophagaceae bacterium]|nr:MAG: T9SS C-terminal target domain-containing protein [Chitinophagaceae bacterium]